MISRHYFSALSVLALGGLLVATNPVRPAVDPNKKVTLVLNGYEMSITTQASDVASLVLAEVGDYEQLLVSPDPGHRLVAGDVITVTDPKATSPLKVVAQNFEVATAPPPPPPAPPKPTPKPKQSPAPVVKTEPAIIDKPETEVYSGLATWYRHGGGLTTASRDFPRGTKLHVVATNSGKSVDVIVNDYGPSAATGIALDLEASAFQVLAPLGAGKISIKYYKL